MPVPFNPAIHGGTNESYRAIARNGRVFFFAGILLLTVAALLLYFFFFRQTSARGGQTALFWIFLVMGVLSMIFGISGLVESSTFAGRVNHLKNSSASLVARGSIERVRTGFRIFGRTLRTKEGDTYGNADTGYFFKVHYVFEDDKERLRREVAIIPDPLGPKRGEFPNQTAVDPNMPRVGMMVDVLFDNYNSVTLRFIPLTHN